MLYLSNSCLDVHRVRFVTSRDYSLNLPYSHLDINDFYQFLESASRIKKAIVLKEKIKRLDKQLSTLTDNQKFTLYVPQFNHSIFQILATHSLCEKTVLMEEGITSYKNDESLYLKPRRTVSNTLSSIYTKRFKIGNGHYNPLPRHKFKFAICINKLCFPLLKNSQKKVVAFSKLYLPEYKTHLENDDTVLLLDSFKERTGISMETYLSLVKLTLEHGRRNRAQLIIKFHPEQKRESRIETVEFIEGNFGFEEIRTLPDSCILEVEFAKCKNLTVIGMHSSLLFYAKALGHIVYSSIQHSMKIPEVREYVEHIMDQQQIATYMNYE